MPTFPAEERIKSRKVLEDVYQNGELINYFPYRLKFMRYKFEKGAPVQIVVAVPKRNVKKAVKRNRIRRQIKEAYRLNKAELLSNFTQQNEGLALFLIYTGKEDQDYHFLEDKLKGLIKKLQEKL